MRKIEVFMAKDTNYYWHMKGSNGEIEAQSEGYINLQNALRAGRNFAALFTETVAVLNLVARQTKRIAKDVETQL